MYADTDLVYVDPDNRCVLGPVEWKADGLAKPLKTPEVAGKRDRGNYPWGTFRSMRHAFLEHKHIESEGGRKTLQDILSCSLEETLLGGKVNG